jgi:hypothetical protein
MRGLQSALAPPRHASMPRIVEPEVLDALDAADPLARRARRDLQRVHRAMRTRAILTRALSSVVPDARGRPLHVLELGAGDGTLMLHVAHGLVRRGWRARLSLLDRQRCVAAETLAAYAHLGWDAAPLVSDVIDWIGTEPMPPSPNAAAPARWDVIVTTLFLHHFEPRTLAALLNAIARRTHAFVACEPRRDRFALAGSHLVGAIGAGPVTRRDAVLSVHAGFAGTELSALWPDTSDDWALREHRAGLFSHCFSANLRDSRRALA